jgi:predicted transcriptional regulator
MRMEAALKTERVTLLVTPAEKAKVQAKADALGMNASEFIRLAAQSYDVNRDEAMMNALLDQVSDTVRDMNETLDRTIARVERTVDGLRQRRLAREAAARARAGEAA